MILGSGVKSDNHNFSTYIDFGLSFGYEWAVPLVLGLPGQIWHSWFVREVQCLFIAGKAYRPPV